MQSGEIKANSIVDIKRWHSKGIVRYSGVLASRNKPKSQLKAIGDMSIATIVTSTVQRTGQDLKMDFAEENHGLPGNRVSLTGCGGPAEVGLCWE
jgi:hypothetical protein